MNFKCPVTTDDVGLRMWWGMRRAHSYASQAAPRSRTPAQSSDSVLCHLNENRDSLNCTETPFRRGPTRLPVLLLPATRRHFSHAFSDRLFLWNCPSFASTLVLLRRESKASPNRLQTGHLLAFSAASISIHFQQQQTRKENE